MSFARAYPPMAELPWG